MGVVPFLLLFFVQTPYGERKSTADWGHPESIVLRPQEEVGTQRPQVRRAEAPPGGAPRSCSLGGKGMALGTQPATGGSRGHMP